MDKLNDIQKPDINGLIEEVKPLVEKTFPKDKIPDDLWGLLDSVFRLIKNKAPSGDVKLINHAVQELVYAGKTFAPYRTTRKVSIFGSARIGPGQTDYELAVNFAKQITHRGFMVITGAGPGIMAAGNEGAGRKRSFGVNIKLPFEQTANEFIENDPKLIDFKYFFTRKVTFVKETDALVLFPGGFGTMDEAFESLTLIQTGKTTPVPIVCLEQPNGSFWNRWLHFLKTDLLGRGLISPNDLNMFKITESPEEACDIITNFYSCYHSQRYVGDDLVFRLLKPIDDNTLCGLNNRFSTLVTQGEIERCDMLPEEVNEPETANMHRLRFKFNKKDFGLLRMMIDFINDHT